ncbi:Replication factor A protein 1 [Entamoeba marina]
MNVTCDAIKKWILNNKVTSPFIVQIQSVVPIDNGERLLATQIRPLQLHVKAKVSDCDYLISTFIICDTIEEADTIKQFNLIEITNGFMLVNNNPSDDLFFAIKKFTVVNNQVNNQLYPNIKELKTKNHFNLYCQNDLSNELITPLNMLTRSTTEFVVKGIVISKSERIEYEGGYLFNFIIQDEDGNELKCICFQDACDKYIDYIKESGTYCVSNGYLQPSKTNYFRTEKMVGFDCIITTNSFIQKSEDSIKRKSNFKLIKELQNCPINVLYSICCQINSISKTKTKKDLSKRIVEVVDQSGWKIEINFWHNLTQIPDGFSVGQIVQFDNLQLRSFNYKHLTYTKSSSFKTLLGSDEAKAYTQKIVENNGSNTQKYSDSISSSIPTLSLNEYEVNTRNSIGKLFKANVTAYIIAFRTDSISYIGCNNCKKKVSHDVIVCPHCNNQKCVPQIFYVLKVEIQDSKCKTWVTMLDEVATKFIGTSAKELVDLKESNFDKYINTFKGKTYTKVKLGLEGKLDDKMFLHTNIFHCQILDETN